MAEWDGNVNPGNGEDDEDESPLGLGAEGGEDEKKPSLDLNLDEENEVNDVDEEVESYENIDYTRINLDEMEDIGDIYEMKERLEAHGVENIGEKKGKDYDERIYEGFLGFHAVLEHNNCFSEPDSSDNLDSEYQDNFRDEKVEDEELRNKARDIVFNVTLNENFGKDPLLESDIKSMLDDFYRISYSKK